MTTTGRSLFLCALVGLVVLASLGAPQTLHAQIQKDTTHWNDADLYQDEEHGAPSYFSVGGGLVGSYFIPDLAAFNKNISVPFTGQTVGNKVTMIGGQGFVTVPWVKNLRVGGIGMSGASDCGCNNNYTDSVSGSHMGRLVDYEIGYGALTLDYVLPLSMGRFHVIPGVALGYGSVNVFTRQAVQNESPSFTNYTAGYPNTTHTYTSHFMLYQPQLQFEYAPTGYMMARLAVGYQGTSMGTWTVDRNVALASSTLFDGINGSGIVASAGLFFGLFQ